MIRMRLVAIGVCATLLAVSGAAGAQQWRGDQHRGDRHQEYRPPIRHRPGVARPDWYRHGGRIPERYRGPTYIVNNWSSYHLSRPPRGYHWVRGSNGDFLLAAIATGVIANIVTGMLAPPPAAVAAPVAAPARYEYYCRPANAYYPYVATCPAPWETVAVPPPPPGVAY